MMPISWDGDILTMHNDHIQIFLNPVLLLSPLISRSLISNDHGRGWVNYLVVDGIMIRVHLLSHDPPPFWTPRSTQSESPGHPCCLPGRREMAIRGGIHISFRHNNISL